MIAGIGLLACVYPLGRRLGLSPPWALLALLFAAADPLGIAQSRIATLDIFLAVWTVLCILLALRYVQDGWRTRWLFACGAAGGMAVATKWSGGLAIVAAALIILVAWLVQRRAARRALADAGEAEAPAPSRAGQAVGPPLVPPRAEAVAAAAPEGSAGLRIAAIAAALVAVPIAVYLLSYTQYFLTGHTLADFRELHRQMITFNLNLKATHTYASLALTWIVDYRPVWYYFEGTKTYHGVIAIGNPFLWWLATLSLVAAVVLALLRRSYALLPAAPSSCVLYVPWFLTTRTSFLYYMTPVAPFMAILVAAALCLFAGGVLPHRGWLAPADRRPAPPPCSGSRSASPRGWLFWTLPRRAGDSLGWIARHRRRAARARRCWCSCSRRACGRYRPWLAMVVAGLVIGIVVAFIPIVLGLPISPEYFEHIMWFPSWI